MIYEFFREYLIFIYFIYGLFFFLMGFAIALQMRAYHNLSELPLSKFIWLLAAFGIAHGLSEWTYLLSSTPNNFSGLKDSLILQIIKVVIRDISFMFLFHFGISLIQDIYKKQWLRNFKIIFTISWTIIFTILLINNIDNIGWFLPTSSAITRYLLAFPGAILSSFGFWIQYRRLKFINELSVARNFKYASIVFLIYAVAAGLIVPKNNFFPASMINMDSFFRVFNIPVQLIRATCGMFMAYFVIKVLEIFNLENRNKLEEIRRINLLCQERNRFSMDLHDGILQQIYIVGLKLENTHYLVQEDTKRTQEQIKEIMNNLDNIVKDIRNYILDLQPSSLSETDLKIVITKIVQNFKKDTNINIDLKFTGNEKNLPSNVCNEIYFIMKEILNNILKHSQATMVKIEINLSPLFVEIIIKDNGIGFDPNSIVCKGSEKRGLKNIINRSKMIEANFDINSEEGKGTLIKLVVNTGRDIYFEKN